MNPVDPFYVKRLCPYCIQEFYPGDCKIVSTRNKGTVLVDAPTGLKRQLARRNPERLDGPKYLKEMACRVCPHCGHELPYNIERVDNISIAVVGDTYSGKSHFIAAFIHQLRDGLAGTDARRYVRFECLTQEVEDAYLKNFYEPLFIKKQRLAATQPAIDPTREPLIYELVIRESKDHPAKKINLNVYDAAGEDQANQSRVVQYSQYILNSDAIIFLADPITMPKIFASLPPHLQNAPVTGRKTATVLNTIIRIYERHKGLEPGSRLVSVPIAITLSKSDLLKMLRPVSQPYSFLTNPEYNGTVDLREQAIIDREVRELIQEFGDQSLLHTTRNFSKVGYFATSATGFAPNDDDTYPRIEPCRCLDPIFWALYKLHIIKADQTA